MPQTKIFQIYYDEASRQLLEPGFIPLDNRFSEDPAWHEFVPMLQYLNTNELEDGVFYGFLSPKFTKKFRCTAAYVTDFLDRLPAQTEVALFSPGWDQLCFFQNPWEQGEVWHPGVTAITREFLTGAGETCDLGDLVTDVTSSGFSNYVVAKKSYWLAWRDLSNQLADFFNAQPELDALTTSYGSIQRQKYIKTFVQERLSSYLLATRAFKTVASTRAKRVPIYQKIFPEGEMVRKSLELCDHFKRKYRSTRDPAYLSAYRDAKSMISFRHPYVKNS